MMQAVKKGGDRQELHERLRSHSLAAARVVKEEGGKNDLLQRIAADPAFGLTMDELSQVMHPALFVGRAPEQVTEYLRDYIHPILKANKAILGVKAELKV